MSRGDGGPAFPGLERFEQWNEQLAKYTESFAPVDGMSLRDWFAGQALAGLTPTLPRIQNDNPMEAVATDAYAFADAMLAERAK